MMNEVLDLRMDSEDELEQPIRALPPAAAGQLAPRFQGQAVLHQHGGLSAPPPAGFVLHVPQAQDQQVLQLQVQLEQLTQLMGAGGAELMHHLRQMNTLVQNHSNQLLQLDSLREQQHPEAPSQEQWNLLDQWSRGIHGAVSQLMQERGPHFQLLEWIQKNISDLSDSMRTISSVIQASNVLLRDMGGSIAHLQRFEAGFSFIKERVATLQTTVEQTYQSDSEDKSHLQSQLENLHTSLQQCTLTLEVHKGGLAKIHACIQAQEKSHLECQERLNFLDASIQSIVSSHTGLQSRLDQLEAFLRSSSSLSSTPPHILIATINSHPSGYY